MYNTYLQLLVQVEEALEIVASVEVGAEELHLVVVVVDDEYSLEEEVVLPWCLVYVMEDLEVWKERQCYLVVEEEVDDGTVSCSLMVVEGEEVG